MTGDRRVAQEPASLLISRPMVLLEREPALEALLGALADAVRGEGRVALVYGEAGIGKTSLVDGFARERARAGPRAVGRL